MFFFVCVLLLLLLLLFVCGIVVLLLGDVELTPGPDCPKYCRLLFGNTRGLRGNSDEPSAASIKFGIICCAETLVSDMRHTSELLLPNVNKSLLVCRNPLPRAQGLCINSKVVLKSF